MGVPPFEHNGPVRWYPELPNPAGTKIYARVKIAEE